VTEDFEEYTTGYPSADIVQFAVDVNHLIGELPSLKTKDAIRTVIAVRQMETGIRQSGTSLNALTDFLGAHAHGNPER